MFINHGGISDVYEAVDAGVLVFGFFKFYVQTKNLEHLIHTEMGKVMNVIILNVFKDDVIWVKYYFKIDQ